MTWTFGSLFSGIGGIDLGLERAGMECRWQVEIDPFCRKVLKKHWPDVPQFGDVKELGERDLESVDVLAGGFPCQPVSLAGRGRAQDDPRWLWPEFERLIRLLGPRYVVVENVPGLAQRGLSIVLGSLADLGFDAEWTCVSAASVGAPHLRDRLFIVAHAESGELREQRRGGSGASRPGTALASVDGKKRHVADAHAIGCDRWGGNLGTRWRRELEDSRSTWASEPDILRVAYGVPDRVDRLKALGNAVVPQVAEFVGRQIMAAS